MTIAVDHITTRQDLSRWTRAHADAPGITWSVLPGQGGTMVIVEGEADRSTLARKREAEATARAAHVTTAATAEAELEAGL